MEIDVLDEIQRLRQQGRKAALATIVQIRGSVPSFQSAKMLIRDDGSTLGSVGGGCVEAEVWTAAQDVLRDEKSKVMSFDLTDESMAESGLICGGKVEIFIEPVLPTPKMVIFGAGHIATQVSKIATIAGFKTTIVDNRPVYANAERFPEDRKSTRLNSSHRTISYAVLCSKKKTTHWGASPRAKPQSAPRSAPTP